ncbi:MAG: phenylalanine--tRNA ligase subunit beta [Candidatus Thorarchaeota archaeon]
MIVECSVKNLLDLVGKKMTMKELEHTLFMLKAEIEKLEGDTIEIEINPDRQDMLSTEGIALALRAFLGINPGLPKHPVRKSGKEIIVQKGLEKIRKYIACGIVKDVEVSDELIKEYMRLQESLTTTHGRNRRKASIGLYVYDDLKFPVTYKTERPDRIHFVPLGYETEMDGPTILREHDKGIEYGPIIAEFKKWPLLVDSEGKILSLPPVINSNDLGRVTEHTRNIFVEVTGTHLPTVEQALNIMVTTLAERHGKIESVTITYPDGTVLETPNLKPRAMTVKIDEIQAMIGLDLKPEEIVESLERMSYDVRLVGKHKVKVAIAPFRTDVLHPVDIIEDVAIGYGFDRIEPAIPSTMTAGSLRPLTRLRNKCRDLMIGAGYQEIMSYVMTSPEIINTHMKRDRPLVQVGNPKSRDYSVLRNSLVPVLLDFASKNQHADYPQKVFEVGDVVVPDAQKETRVDQYAVLCGLTTDTRVNLTELMTDIGFLLRGMGLDGRFKFKSRNDESFIQGRSGTILVDDQEVGYFGEVAPDVLEAFELGYPVITFELFLPSSGDWNA